MAREEQFQTGVNTHENVIFSCYGGTSNTGITGALASLEAVKELGLEKAAVAVAMGYGARGVCPATFVEAEDWGLADLEGQPLPEARKIRDEIGARVVQLLKRVDRNN